MPPVVVRSYTKAAIDAFRRRVFSRKTATYTIQASDEGKCIEINVASGTPWPVLLIPTNTEAPLPIGFICYAAQYGARSFEIDGTSGTVDVRSFLGPYSAGQYARITLEKLAANEWYIYGDLIDTIDTE